MTSKTRRTIAIINTTIVALMVIGGAMAKLLMVNSVVEDFAKLGVVRYIRILGISELLFLALLLYPRTMRIGYILLFSYLAGAIATHLAHGEISFQPAIPMIFITLSVVLRDRSFFIPASGHFIN